MKKEEIKIRITFYVLFGILVFFILLIPHIFMGHVFISQNYAQSTALLADLIVGYLFYRFYQRKMKSLYEEKMQTEKRLIYSYGYIGKINNTIDIFKRFGRFFSQQNSEIKEDEIFNALLSNLIVSVAKAEKGFLRFIDIKNGRTLKEFYFSENGDDTRVKVSNAAILGGKSNNEDKISVIESDYNNTGVCCIICIQETNNIDVELVKPLLNQTHLLYLVFNKKMTYKKSYGT